jgi:hypothetical protein
MKKITLLLAVCVCLCAATSGCIEIGKRSYSAGPNLAKASVVEHTYLFGGDGVFTKTYDVTITMLGVEILNIQGITKNQLQAYLAKYGADR